MSTPRYTALFLDGCAEANRLEVTYWFESDGRVSGEAYFRRDDLYTPVVNGLFEHPYTGLCYKLHPPSRFGKSTDAILDVLRWTEVGRSEPHEVIP